MNGLGSKTHIFQQSLQFVVLLLVHKNMLVVDVFDNEAVCMLRVYSHDDGLDGRIALYEHSCVQNSLA